MVTINRRGTYQVSPNTASPGTTVLDILPRHSCRSEGLAFAEYVSDKTEDERQMSRQTISIERAECHDYLSQSIAEVTTMQEENICG